MIEVIKKLKPQVVVTGLPHFEAVTSSAFVHLLNVTREIGARLFLDISDHFELSSLPGSSGVLKYLAGTCLPSHAAIICGLVMVGRCLCCSDGETVDHLLLHCPISHVLWSFLFRSFHVNWVAPRSVKDLFFGWRNWFGKHHSDIWNLAPLCLMWIVWLERNSRTFEDMQCSTDQLLEKFVSSLFDWSRVWGFTTAVSVADFIVSLSFVPASHSIL
jgi:hypothetical protein